MFIIFKFTLRRCAQVESSTQAAFIFASGHLQLNQQAITSQVATIATPDE